MLRAGNLLLVSPVVGPDEVNRRVCDESEKEDDKNETKSGPHLVDHVERLDLHTWLESQNNNLPSPAASTITLATCTCYYNSRVTPCADSNSKIVAIPYAFAPGPSTFAVCQDLFCLSGLLGLLPCVGSGLDTRSICSSARVCFRAEPALRSIGERVAALAVTNRLAAEGHSRLELSWHTTRPPE